MLFPLTQIHHHDHNDKNNNNNNNSSGAAIGADIGLGLKLHEISGGWTWMEPALSFDLCFIVLGHAFILALQWYWGVLIAQGLYKAIAGMVSGGSGDGKKGKKTKKTN